MRLKKNRIKKRILDTTTAGLGLLTLTGAVGLWSATNSSVFALKNWATTPEAKANARSAMKLGMVSIGALALGSYLISKNLVITIATLGIGVGLYAYYESILKTNLELSIRNRISGLFHD